MNSRLRRGLNRFGLLALARRVREATSDAHREAAARKTDALTRVRANVGPAWSAAAAGLPATSTVLAIGLDQVESVVFQAPLLAAFRRCGHRIVILLASRDRFMEAAYRAFGVDGFAYFEDHLHDGEHPAAAELMQSVTRIDEMIALAYCGAAVGRYVVSTEMRRERSGDPVLTAATRTRLAAALLEVLHHTDAAAAILDAVAPAAALFLDHGYTPHGQVFDLAMARGASCFTWNAAHRDGMLMVKRYGPGNRDQHPSSLSPPAWAALRAMPWTSAHWQRLRDEIEGCYRSGEWYGEVGTQFGKVFPTRDALVARLGLDPAKPTASLFPHIFWDATFFWGTDLFRNYEDWFLAALRAACANPHLNWVVKVHPGNIVKDRRDRHSGEHSEIAAIRRSVGSLPDHVKLIPAESDISTFALLAATDYCLTVRGTIGIEAACFGIPVITAGTGRYDRLGFTVDPSSPDAYLDLLAQLHTLPALDARRTELARRYAYGVFIARPVRLRAVSFGYAQDATASLKAEVSAQARTDPFAMQDVRSLADWIASGAEDYLDAEALGAELIAAQ